MTAQINKDFRRRVARELFKLRELWLDMRREGLGMESDEGTRSPEQEWLLSQAEWAFEMFARVHLSQVLGVNDYYRAAIVSQFPEFPDEDEDDEDEPTDG
jgi:hypothetical protein